MSTPKFDSNMIELLLGHYRQTIIDYSIDNDELSKKLNDLKTSLLLNLALLMQYTTLSYGNSSDLVYCLSQFKHFLEENIQLIHLRNSKELESYHLQELVEDTPTRIREEIKGVYARKGEIEKVILQKEAMAKKLQGELEKVRKNLIVKHPRIEVIVAAPNKKNVIINNEIESACVLYKKVIEMTAKEKSTANILEKDVNSLKKEIEELKLKMKEKKSFHGLSERKVINRQLSFMNSNTLKKIDSSFNSSRLNNQSQLHYDSFTLITKPLLKDNNEISDYSINEDKRNDLEDNQMMQRMTLRYRNNKTELKILQMDYDTISEVIIRDEMKIHKYRSRYKDMKEKIDNLISLIKEYKENKASNNKCIIEEQ